jgi:DNA-binding beta-propeller fold protein YncE
VLAAAVIAVLVLALGGGDPKGAAGPRAPRVDRISLGAGAGAGPMVADATGAYVLDPAKRQLIKILSRTRQISRLSLPSEPRELALSPDGRTLWIALTGRRLERVDLEAARPIGKPIRLRVEANYLAVTDQRVAALSGSRTGGRLQLVDARRGRVLGGPIFVGGAPTDMVPDAEDFLILLAFPPTLMRYDGRGKRTAQLQVQAGGLPPEMALDGRGTAWLSVYDAGQVVRGDPRTGKPTAPPVKVGAKPQGIAVDGDDVWVAGRGSGTLTRIDARTGKAVGKPVAAGELGGFVAAASGVAWAAGTNDVIRVEPVG